MKPSEDNPTLRSCARRAGSVVLPVHCAMLTWTAIVMAATVATLAGCADGVGTILADPGRYSALHCRDMAARWVFLNTRERELQNLLIRAGEGTAGTVIGAMAYRPEYEQVITEKRLLRRAATEKKCDLVPQSTFQSDNIVR